MGCREKFNKESPFFSGLGVCCRCFHLAECRKRERDGLRLNSGGVYPVYQKVIDLANDEKATKRPELTGELTVNRKAVGKIALWIQDENVGTKRPLFAGNIDVDGSKTYVVAWLHGYELKKLKA